MMKHVIGIDPSLVATGIQVLDSEGRIISSRVVSSKPSGGMVANRMKRLHAMVTEIKEIVYDADPCVICLEHYTIGSNTPGTADRIEFGGLLRYVLWMSGFRVVEVNQSTLKKWATGKGKFPPGAGKTPMIVSMTSRYGVQFSTDDEYDAYALARMALQIADYEQPANQQQREAVSLVTTEKVKKTRKAKAAYP